MSDKKKKSAKDIKKSKDSKESSKNETTIDDESSDSFEMDLDSDEENSDVEEDIENEIILEDDKLEDDLLDDNDDEYEMSESQNALKSNLDDDEEDDVFEYIEPEEENQSENLRVPDNERITIPRLTKYEKVRILGTRIKQISDGSKIFIKSKDIKNATDIAALELQHKVIPLKIKRPLPDGRYEIWSVNELSSVD